VCAFIVLDMNEHPYTVVITSIEEVMYLPRFVFLRVGLLRKLWIDFHDIFGRDKKQSVRFWKLSASESRIF